MGLVGVKWVCIREVFISWKPATGSQGPLPSSLSIRASDHHILTDSLKVSGTLQSCRDSEHPRAGNEPPSNPGARSNLGRRG